MVEVTFLQGMIQTIRQPAGEGLILDNLNSTIRWVCLGQHRKGSRGTTTPQTPTWSSSLEGKGLKERIHHPAILLSQWGLEGLLEGRYPLDSGGRRLRPISNQSRLSKFLPGPRVTPHAHLRFLR